jgi:hypothetical protein
VYDEGGGPIGGVYVQFQLDKPSLASISPSVVATESNGIAKATLTARDQQGNLIITATSDDTTSEDKSFSILSGVSPDQINVSASPSTILVLGTSTVTAEVLGRNGEPVPDGTFVSFDVPNTNFGSMSPPSDATLNGFATSTFVAGEQAGIATVEVSVGNINNSTDLIINQSQPASLEFVSAEPQRITIQGSAGNETSVIKFLVVDENGNPVSGIPVTMEIEKGPDGGEYIDTDDTPETIEVSSDADGVVTVILRSGDQAGAVTIKGTMNVNGILYAAKASIVSIGGGVPNAGRFSVAVSRGNVPGLDHNNVTTDVTAYMSDRYGNYNILAGTTVSFWSEAALAVDASEATVNEDGLATVVARTQHPVLDLNDPNYGGKDVQPFAWEQQLLSYVNSTYGFLNPTTPRDGQVAVMVYTQGEEDFDDLNSNGMYDAGEPYRDTHDDPFLDYNDNNVYNYLGVDPAEIFNDVNDTGEWNTYNNQYDQRKDVFTNFRLLITGEPYPYFSTGSFSIPKGGAVSFTVLFCDRNLNPPAAGTKVAVSSEGPVKLFGFEREFGDVFGLPGQNGSMGSHLAEIEYGVTLINDNDSEDAELVTVCVAWEWSNDFAEAKGEICIAGTAE